jgi:hypothetical protein
VDEPVAGSVVTDDTATSGAGHGGSGNGDQAGEAQDSPTAEGASS